jgi:hypothetical protein
VIAHHLDTIRRADVIFVVKDSAIVERGTHDSLFAAGGVYATSCKRTNARQRQANRSSAAGECLSRGSRKPRLSSAAERSSRAKLTLPARTWPITPVLRCARPLFPLASCRRAMDCRL